MWPIGELEVDTGIIIRTAVMLVGLACVYYAAARMLRRRRVRRDPVHASGTVIALDLVPSEDGPDWFTPTVRYADDAGATHEAKLSIVRDSKAYAVGKKVPIVYERVNPTNLIDSNDGWAETIALSLILGFGLIVLLFGALAEVVPAE
jgi:hypothetical protein